jgi:hypothetical protein
MKVIEIKSQLEKGITGECVHCGGVFLVYVMYYSNECAGCYVRVNEEKRIKE